MGANGDTGVWNWPHLPVAEWHDTLETVHRWTQIVGKVRLVSGPWLNHSWGVTLYGTPTGLTTGLISHGTDAFEMRFDFAADELEIATSAGERGSIELRDGLAVSEFYGAALEALAEVGVDVEIDTMPNEIADAVRFPDDDAHATYVGEHVRAWHRALLSADRVFTEFRAGFRGKASPVHFFWGSFDLAATRFSGRDAPRHPGGLPNFPDDVAAEAYSHEVTSVGFWPGDRDAPDAIFYAYAYPTPDGFSDAPIEPAEAFWLDALGEHVLPYEAVATADDPDGTLLRFCESAHAAAADLAGWDRHRLECDHPHGPHWWSTRPHHESSAVQTDDDLAVRDDVDRHRFVISVDGTDRGEAVYRRRGDRWLFVHTETDPAFAGRGLGSTLARAALDDVSADGGRVVPICPFIADWIERHTDYEPLVDHELLDQLTKR